MVQRFANRTSPDNFVDVGIPPLGEFKQEGIVNFTHGYASPPDLPKQQLNEAVQTILSDRGDVALQYGPARGTTYLREALVDYLSEEYHIETEIDNIAIITGSKQGLDMMCKGFLDPGDAVVVTEPTYGTGLKIMKSHEAEFITVSVDKAGIDVNELADTLEERVAAGESIPKFIFDVPEFHNPTGVTMSPERRKQLIDLAERYDMKIIEDAPYRKLRFEGQEIPPIKSIDTAGTVVFLGTYSKLICPGLRVGWMVAEQSLIDRIIPMKEDGGTSPFTQTIIGQLHESGYIQERTVSYTNHLEQKRDAAVIAIQRYLPDADIWHVPEGGYYMWVEMPEEVDTVELLEFAREEGVLYLPGASFAPRAGFDNYLRIAWAYEDTQTIEDGIQRLAAAWDAYRAQQNIKDPQP